MPSLSFAALLGITLSVAVCSLSACSKGSEEAAALPVVSDQEVATEFAKLQSKVAANPQLRATLMSAQGMTFADAVRSVGTDSIGKTAAAVAKTLGAHYPTLGAFIAAQGVDQTVFSKDEVKLALLAAKLNRPVPLAVFSAASEADRGRILASALKVSLLIQATEAGQGLGLLDSTAVGPAGAPGVTTDHAPPARQVWLIAQNTDYSMTTSDAWREGQSVVNNFGSYDQYEKHNGKLISTSYAACTDAARQMRRTDVNLQTRYHCAVDTQDPTTRPPATGNPPASIGQDPPNDYGG